MFAAVDFSTVLRRLFLLTLSQRKALIEAYRAKLQQGKARFATPSEKEEAKRERQRDYWNAASCVVQQHTADIAMSIAPVSQFFILSPRGDTIISKDYRGDAVAGTTDIFFRKASALE